MAGGEGGPWSTLEFRSSDFSEISGFRRKISGMSKYIFEDSTRKVKSMKYYGTLALETWRVFTTDSYYLFLAYFHKKTETMG